MTFVSYDGDDVAIDMKQLAIIILLTCGLTAACSSTTYSHGFGQAGTTNTAGSAGEAGAAGDAGSSGSAGTVSQAGSAGEAGTATAGFAGVSGSAGQAGTAGGAGSAGTAGTGGCSGIGGYVTTTSYALAGTYNECNAMYVFDMSMPECSRNLCGSTLPCSEIDSRCLVCNPASTEIIDNNCYNCISDSPAEAKCQFCQVPNYIGGTFAPNCPQCIGQTADNTCSQCSVPVLRQVIDPVSGFPCDRYHIPDTCDKCQTPGADGKLSGFCDKCQQYYFGGTNDPLCP
jgi:hypothetical protein